MKKCNLSSYVHFTDIRSEQLMAQRMDKGMSEDMMNASTRRRPDARRKRGAVQVEYAFLLVFVMVPAAGVLLAGGRQMYTMYTLARTALLSSSP